MSKHAFSNINDWGCIDKSSEEKEKVKKNAESWGNSNFSEESKVSFKKWLSNILSKFEKLSSVPKNKQRYKNQQKQKHSDVK